MKKFLFALLTLGTLSAMHASAQDSSAHGGFSQVPATLGASAPDPIARTSPARWSLAVAAGPAFPVGSFHRSAGVDGESLTAQSGGSVEVSGSYRFWRSFSATLVAEGQENRGSGIPDWFYPPGALESVSATRGNDWKLARILTGATYALPLTKKTGPALLFRLLGGIQKTASPDYNEPFEYLGTLFTCLNCGVPAPITYAGISFPWSFAYEADAGLQWRFHRRLSAVGYAGYTGSKPSKDLLYFGVYDTTTNSYTTYSRRNTTSTGTISLRAGVSYELSR
jgi:hypothetical protein